VMPGKNHKKGITFLENTCEVPISEE